MSVFVVLKVFGGGPDRPYPPPGSATAESCILPSLYSSSVSPEKTR